jgi:WD40 repeat protein
MRAVNLPDAQVSPRIFVSYAREDGEEAARHIVDLLTEHGLAAFLDHADLEGGIDWWRQIEAVLQKVEHLVLVLTPAALKSANVEREWRYARRQGVQVSPVQIERGLEVTHLPHWMQNAHRSHLTIAEHVRRLLLVLLGPSKEMRVPFMASPPEAGFIPRPHEYESLKKAILTAGNEPVAITAALRGAGGFGKTELARFLCHDENIEEVFDGGILWLTLGQTPLNPVAMLADLTAALSGRIPEATGLDAAKAALAEALDDRSCLLVIDDVWHRLHLEPFLHRGPKDRTTRLITTRDDNVRPLQAKTVRVDAMQPREAISLLTRSLVELPAVLRPRIDDLAQKTLGGWPLVLSQANALLCDRVAQGEPLERGFNYLESSLAARGITGTLRADDPEDRRRSAQGTLELSLGQLKTDREREMFFELGVFCEDADITFASISALWGCGEFEVDYLSLRLRQLSLVQHLDLNRRTLRLHDVIRSLSRARLGSERLAELEAVLVGSWRARCNGNWFKLNDLYALCFLPAHLCSLGASEDLTKLLLDPRWLGAKATLLGIPALLADYRSFSGDPLGAAGRVGRALDLASGSGASPDELPAQLLGRLSPGDAPELGICLAAAATVIPLHALVPLHPTLTAPGHELRRFAGHEDIVNAVAVSVDGRRALSASNDCTLRVWDLDTGNELRRFTGHTGRVNAVAVLADGQRGSSASNDGTLRLWDLNSGSQLRCFAGHEDAINAVAVLTDGRRALSASDDRTLRLWDLESGVELRRFLGHGLAATAVTALADGRRLLSASADETLRLWDLDSGVQLYRFGCRYYYGAIAVLADGRRALWASTDNTLHLRELELGAGERHFFGHKGSIRAIAVLADGRRAVSASDDHTLRVWDLNSGDELSQFVGHEGPVSSVAALADGHRLLSASWDRTLRLWEVDNGGDRRSFTLPGDRVINAVATDGRRALATSGGLGNPLISYNPTKPPTFTLDLWDLDSGHLLRCFQGHEADINAIAVLADGRRALSASYDRTLRLWDLDTGAALRCFTGHEDKINAIAVLGEGRRALSASNDRTLRLWDLNSGKALRCFTGHEDKINAIAVLAEGRRALSASDDCTLRLWDLGTGAALGCFTGHEDEINAIAVLAGGRRALSASDDCTFRLWDLDTGNELRCFTGHEAYIYAISVLADGRRALSASGDGTLRLWDLDSGIELRRFDNEGKMVNYAVLMDGRHALSACWDRILRLWELETGLTLSTLHFDARLSCLAIDGRDRAVIGDYLGRLHWIAIKMPIPS